MTFKEATDQLGALGIGLPEIAEALGLEYQTVRAMRAAAGTRAARTPPAETTWRPALAKLAQERAGALAKLASVLTGG